LQADQLLRERAYPIDVIACPTEVHPHVAAVYPTQVRNRLRERGKATLPLRIVFVKRHERANAPHPLALLCACRERPRRRAAEERDEFPPSKANATRRAPQTADGAFPASSDVVIDVAGPMSE
jgi:hypothetical protein